MKITDIIITVIVILTICAVSYLSGTIGYGAARNDAFIGVMALEFNDREIECEIVEYKGNTYPMCEIFELVEIDGKYRVIGEVREMINKANKYDKGIESK